MHKILMVIPIIVVLAVSIPFIINSTSSGAHFTQEIDPRILEATGGFALSSNMDIYKINLIDEGKITFRVNNAHVIEVRGISEI